MKKTQLKRMLSFFVCMVLIAAMALSAGGCGNGKTLDTTDGVATGTATVKGEGAKVFDFTVIDRDGNTTAFEVHTDNDTVGEALLDAGLIAGDDGPYGLYVKTVNGITLDYDTDGLYWAFYENGAYAAKGVDQTEIKEGVTYTFKADS